MSSPESVANSSSSPSTPSSGYGTPLPSSFSAALPAPASNPISGPSLKKSHARKQPPGHIPRPCNAFILFRCDFVRQKKIPASVEHDHRNISRIAGKVWQEMSKAEKGPWLLLAEQEREKHQKAYPGYRYASSSQSNSQSKRKQGKDTVEGRSRARGPIRRRSSSCPPPGAMPVPPTVESYPSDIPHLPCTRDDLSRRPSKTVMYQVTRPHPQLLHSESPFLTLQDDHVYLANVTFQKDLPKNRLFEYGQVDPPKGMPGWDSAPPKPYLWNTPGAAPQPDFTPREPLTGNCQRQNISAHDLNHPHDWLPIMSSFTDPFSQTPPDVLGQDSYPASNAIYPASSALFSDDLLAPTQPIPIGFDHPDLALHNYDNDITRSLIPLSIDELLVPENN
ncbi:hypothetical protein ONZ45_g15887 [Pleurotus djamor]|nr:hypothetical protein ONZ45_g15887 [Pleurotus djamor]